ncbi:hypothetical protein DYB25_010357 [Aphanomyces astaci]|uniref:Uncharacterized protein n=2 Tax=Aphanomyces astaci TaxID=112090 RepID=A0A397CXI0_APHAT|nr:hypothetical protein DYB25_010357 [Aphanomyces astaci]RHY53885.1 hypothetical protein DYB38_002432 [Aphanomyces astaci]RHY71288.1 hypothetical protein DYB34_006427 [Aphanomyces astaci]RHY71637.1 hypothetical protein DYB30_000166 [Aphanomyces astaci]RHZ26513.1 hypothetical protein DYB31_006424 [Aphanomyces astaci]
MPLLGFTLWLLSIYSNVNRRGSPPTIRGCLLSDRSTIKDYIDELKGLYYEQRRMDDAPRLLQLPDVLLRDDSKAKGDQSSDLVKNHAFHTVKLIEGGVDGTTGASHVLSGGITVDGGFFYLWRLHDLALCGTIALASAACFDVCATALAIGTLDGTVKVWDLAAWVSKSSSSPPPSNPRLLIIPPTTTLALRSHLTLTPFLRTRSSGQAHKISLVKVDLSDGSFLQAAATTDKGDVHVWDATKSEIILSLAPDRYNQLILSSLMLFRNTLVCGTSAGLVRIFDLRNGKLTHRISGHPDAIQKTDTKGRVLWTAGHDGSVRWWGGKNAKVCPKSALCRGGIGALEMDETAVVAGYADGGMQAWDVRTQQPLCTFASSVGVSSLQFDKRKLVSVSKNGVACVWRWYAMYPHGVFPRQHTYTCVCFDEKHLVLGTTGGVAVVYTMEGGPAKKPTSVYDY